MKDNHGRPLLLVHPYCLSSLGLLSELRKRYVEGINDKLDIRMLTVEYQLIDPFLLVPSVPALVVNGGIVGLDPLEPEYVAGYVEDDRDLMDKYLSHTPGEALERLAKTILSSSYLLVPLLLNPKGLSELLWNNGFLRAAVRPAAGLEDIRHYINERLSELTARINNVGLRITAYNYLRECRMAYGDNSISGALSINHILFWLNAKNSIGRAYMSPGSPHRYRSYRIVAGRILEVLDERFERYMEKLRSEERMVKSYWVELGLNPG